MKPEFREAFAASHRAISGIINGYEENRRLLDQVRAASDSLTGLDALEIRQLFERVIEANCILCERLKHVQYFYERKLAS